MTERKSGPRRSADVSSLAFPGTPIVREDTRPPGDGGPVPTALRAAVASAGARIVPTHPPADFGAQRGAQPAVSLPELPAMPAPMARRELERWRVRVRPLAGKLARLLRDAHELRVALADELAQAEAAGIPETVVRSWLADAGIPHAGANPPA